MRTIGYAASEPGGRLEPMEFELADPGPDRVVIEVSHCGVCHSDIHMLDNDWGMSSYPIIPGHEAVGTVVSCGSSVTNVRPGQRVGVGWQSASCGGCECCKAGDEHFCPSIESTCVQRKGGFAKHVEVQGRLAIPLPDGLDSAAAAPLLCSGITVYNPLVEAGVRAGQRVGVIGIGGLGHLAIQFARAMGATVVAISSSPGKKEQAMALGASEFALLGNAGDSKALARSLDLLINTVMFDLEWVNLMRMLRPRGKLWFLGIPPSPIPVPVFALLGGQLSITASPIGSPGRIAEMLRFAMEHQVKPGIEPMPFDKINDAFQKAREGKVRYQVVLHH